MSAFLVFSVKLKDKNKWGEYLPQAQASIGKYGGELLIRGPFKTVISGEAPEHQIGGVLKFKSVDDIYKWYASDEYSPLIPLREEAAVVNQTIYEVSE